MEDGMEDFWYAMEWKISGMEWNCMEDFACYGRRKIYIPFHSMPCFPLITESSQRIAARLANISRLSSQSVTSFARH